MDYSPEQYLSLVQAVEDIGGEHLDTLCAAREYELTGPKGKQPDRKLILPGCGNYSVFRIPYASPQGELQPIDACAVCDDLGRWPRIAEEM